MNPGEYEAWHQTARGRWIADREFDLMIRLLNPPAGAMLLDAVLLRKPDQRIYSTPHGNVREIA